MQFYNCKMAPRHRRAYTDTHCVNVSSSVAPFQNAGGILYRKTVTNLDSISLVTTPSSFLRPLSVMQKVFQLQMGEMPVQELWHLNILRIKKMRSSLFLSWIPNLYLMSTVCLVVWLDVFFFHKNHYLKIKLQDKS